MTVTLDCRPAVAVRFPLFAVALCAACRMRTMYNIKEDYGDWAVLERVFSNLAKSLVRRCAYDLGMGDVPKLPWQVLAAAAMYIDADACNGCLKKLLSMV